AGSEKNLGMRGGSTISLTPIAQLDQLQQFNSNQNQNSFSQLQKGQNIQSSEVNTNYLQQGQQSSSSFAFGNYIDGIVGIGGNNQRGILSINNSGMIVTCATQRADDQSQIVLGTQNGKIIIKRRGDGGSGKGGNKVFTV
ncbi:MAG: hypothetical protein EZS28_048319, partial [Streblomastix strix]